MNNPLCKSCFNAHPNVTGCPNARNLMSACAVLIRNGKLATIKSNKLNGAITLPGGKSEANEEPWQALLRECKEEIGREVHIVRLLLVAQLKEHLCWAFLVECDEELISSKEGDVYWATPEELLSSPVYSDYNAMWMPAVTKELGGPDACRRCGGTSWLEVHPEVCEGCGYVRTFEKLP